MSQSDYKAMTQSDYIRVESHSVLANHLPPRCVTVVAKDVFSSVDSDVLLKGNGL